MNTVRLKLILFCVCVCVCVYVCVWVCAVELFLVATNDHEMKWEWTVWGEMAYTVQACASHKTWKTITGWEFHECSAYLSTIYQQSNMLYYGMEPLSIIVTGHGISIIIIVLL